MSNLKTILISFFVGAIVYAVFGKKIVELVTKKKSESVEIDEELKSTSEK